MLSAERLQARRAGIGGSDIGAILGKNKYRTPLDVYLEKTGEKDPDDLSGNAAVEWGIRLEDVIAEKFADDTGLKVRRNNRLLVGDEPFMLANIDRGIAGKPEGVKAGLECKTSDPYAFRADEWGPGAEFYGRGDALEVVQDDDRVPDSYLFQCVWYMAITGADLWFLSVLVGGRDFRTYTIRRDDELIDIVKRVAGIFWREKVLARVPPAPQTQADIETLYAMDNGKAVEASPELLHTWARVKELQTQIKALETELNGTKIGRTYVGGLKDQLRKAIGEHSELLLSTEGKPLATWKQSKSSKVFDLEKFKKDHPKLHREYQVERPGPRVLLIKG
ncbi:MAG: YqaJ viral recombinase family protein [Pseudomonadota bacterium]